MISSILSFIVTMYMAGVIEKSQMGKYALYCAVYYMSGTFLTAGVDRSFLKFISNETSENQYITKLFLFVSIICLIVFAILGFLLSPFCSIEIWMGIVSIGPFICTHNASYVFRAKLEKKYEIILFMSISLINSALTFWLLHYYKNEMSPIVADFISLLVPSFVIVYIFIQRIEKPIWGENILINNRKDLIDFFSFSKPLWLAGLAFTINSQQTTFLLKFFLSYQSLGDYYFAKRMLSLVGKPLDILSKVLLAGFVIKKNVSINNYQKALSLYLLLFPCIALFVLKFLPLALEISGLEKYSSSSFYVSLFLFTFPLACTQAVMGIVNIVLNAPKTSQDSYVFTSIVMIPGGFVLIYYFGVAGAACAISFYSLILFAANVFFLMKISKEHAILSLKRGVLVQFLFSFCMFFPFNNTSSLFMSFLSVPIYFLLGHMFKIWNLNDCLELIKITIQRKKI